MWKSRLQHILFFFAYVIDYNVYCSLLLDVENGVRVEKHFLFIALMVTMGGPLVFLQMCIGQYTNSTCLFLGEMFPLATGLGYSMLLLAFGELFIQVYYSSKLVYYTVLTVINMPPAWMNCLKSFYHLYPNCFSKKNIDECPGADSSDGPCFPPGSQRLSALIFKEVIVFGRVKLPPEATEVGTSFVSDKLLVILFCLCNLITVYVLLMVAICRTTKSFYTPMKMGIVLCMGLLLVIGVVLFIQPGVVRGLNELWEHCRHLNLFSLTAWSSTVVTVISSLRLAEGGHILFGSFMSQSKPDFWRAIHLTAGFTLLIFASTIYYHLFFGMLLYKLNEDPDLIIDQTDENIIFVLFPTFLGILPSPSFFSFVFFFVLFLVNFFSMVVKIIVIEKSFTIFFHVPEYFVYFRITICSLSVLVAFSLENNHIATRLQDFERLKDMFSLVIVAVQILMAIVYGLQNIVDDIEYMTRIKVLTIVKLCWIFSIILCNVGIYGRVHKINILMYPESKFVLIVCISAPPVIAFIVKFFQFARDRNLIGLLRPTERYGPPDLEERILRILYNPRLAVKYKRREEICQHDCLLGSTATRVAVEEEYQQLRHFTKQLKFKEEEKVLGNEVIELFNKHQKYLLRAIDKEPTNEDPDFTDSEENLSARKKNAQ